MGGVFRRFVESSLSVSLRLFNKQQKKRLETQGLPCRVTISVNLAGT